MGNQTNSKHFLIPSHLYRQSSTGISLNLEITVEISVAVPWEVGKQSTPISVITHLEIQPKDILSYHKDTCLTMLTAVLFTVAKFWKQPLYVPPYKNRKENGEQPTHHGPIN